MIMDGNCQKVQITDKIQKSCLNNLTGQSLEVKFKVI